MRTLVAVSASFAVAASVAGVGGAQAPDRLYVNAMVWTADDAHPSAEAFAVRGDRLMAVGSNADVRALAGPNTSVVDLGGRRVVPGFNDAHWHFRASRGADLDGAGNVAEIQKRLQAYARDLPAGGMLTDRDGHQALANARALALRI